MKKTLIAIIFISILCYSLTGCKSSPSCCTIAPPLINMTGEKTVIERQIVGDYMELEKDAWTVSSVRTTVEKKENSSQTKGDSALIKAIKERDASSEKIREFKNEGAIGENNSGYIAYIESSKYESSPELKKSLLAAIDEENAARKKIFVKSLSGDTKKTPGDKEIESFGKMFADEQRVLAKEGDWIQENSGKWIRKK